MSELTRHTFSEREEFDLLPSADYEVTLELAEPRTTDSGKEYLNLKFRIRSDVDSNATGKNRVIFDKLWKDKFDTNWYDLKKLQKIILTQKGLPTYKLDFQDVDECVQYINGLNMKITIIQKFDDYRNADVNEIQYMSYAPSTAVVTDKFEKKNANLDSIGITDSELPW